MGISHLHEGDKNGMKQILLVEDDLSLISGLSFAVKKAGYGLNIAHTKNEADEKWEDGKSERPPNGRSF